MEVLRLPAEDFERLLREQPELEFQLREIVGRRLAENAAMHRDQARTNQLAGAIKRGLLRGTHVLVRNPLLCEPNCRACEDACATRHGQPRIHLDGVQLNGLDVTALEIGPEIDPGVPWTRAIGGRDMVLALKSGNFGAPDFFLKAWEKLS